MKKAMLFAAGLGTRLKPLTDHCPKALVEIDGQPLLALTLERLIAEGFEQVVVNVHHFASMIKEYLASHSFDIDIQISDESDELLDTGGGLRKALSLFHEDSDPILIHNVDILSDADLAALYPEQRTLVRILRILPWRNGWSDGKPPPKHSPSPLRRPTPLVRLAEYDERSSEIALRRTPSRNTAALCLLWHSLCGSSDSPVYAGPPEPLSDS